MAQVTVEQAEKGLNEGGGKFFKLRPDEFATVRFLWDNLGDVKYFKVHEIKSTKQDGSSMFATVDCANEQDSMNVCQYCNSKSQPVYRVIIPLYNVEEDKIQYWKRSYSWYKNTLKPILEEYTNLASLASQQFKIKRTGSDMNNTSYTPIPVGVPDNSTKVSFGEVEDFYNVGIIKKTLDNQQQTAQQPQQSPTNYAPRRTADF